MIEIKKHTEGDSRVAKGNLKLPKLFWCMVLSKTISTLLRLNVRSIRTARLH